MKKLLKLHDLYTLKVLVCFLLIFTALYPKLPSVHIIRTWVYIRLEDFFILAAVMVWFIQLVRRKVSVPLWLSGPIATYWLAGLISLIFSFIFIAPNLTNFFPHVAALNYLRRIEYMILFFVAFSTIKSYKDIRDYFVILSGTLLAVLLYGFGQRNYLFLWSLYPKFFQSFSFCFPSFQTGNEEFAKGIPLCLPQGSRITSTFGGHYDLAGYLVLVLPIFLAVSLSVRRWAVKIGTALLFVGGLILLIFTASRVSFGAYLFGSIATLIFYRKKWYIIPVVFLSIVLLLSFSESTAKRFLSTVRISSIVTNNEGELIGETTSGLPQDLKNKISQDPVTKSGSLPKGSAFIGLGNNKSQSKKNTVVQKPLTPEEARRLQLAEGSLKLSTVSGNFVVQKALVYDISFTTRFQSEWPNAWRAFMMNPAIGSGYSTITLATDNDYLRALGEVGLFGLFSFVLIFIVLAIAFAELIPHVKSPIVRGFAYGTVGGVLGLAGNAVLIDVFEASKVAEPLWIILGIAAGGLYLYKHSPIPYMQRLKKVLTSGFFIGVYLLIILGAAFSSSVSHFFVADDFTWLNWAAVATFSDIIGYFTNSQNFFYRPLDKTIVVLLYNFFAFQPNGYHVFTLAIHFLATIAVYLIGKKLLKSKLLGAATAFVFLLHPAHGENIYWFSTISVTLGTLFVLYALNAFINYRQQSSWRAVLAYIAVFVFSVLAFLSYEIAVVIPFLLIAADMLIFKPKRNWETVIEHIPFLTLLPLYYLIRQLTHAFNGGGDYSYNLSHMIPNVLGNIFGYLGLFFSGHAFLPVYDALRENLRQEILVFSLIALILILFFVWLGYFFRKPVTHYAKTLLGKSVLFGIVFGLISLVPFLALGNIAERYLYLASAGFILAFIAVLQSIVGILAPHNRKKHIILVIIVVLIVGVMYQIENARESEKWNRAGEITKGTLALFRVDYPQLHTTDDIYFIDIPVKYDGVWVFPVGLRDALWFIYGSDLPMIRQANSLEDAQMTAQTTNAKRNFIFQFDKEGKIRHIK